MKVLLLNGEKSINENLSDYVSIIGSKFALENIDFEVIHLHEYEIKDCIGCFGCWIESPGECIIDDHAGSITEKIIQSDLLIFLSPIVFGGYSYQLKKILDRSISLISPFFMKINGEIHHKKRYKKYPSLIGIGINNQKNEKSAKIFQELIQRNSINFHSPYCNSVVLQKDDPLEKNKQIIDSLLEQGVKNHE